jgi:hypothetical protein
MDAGLYILHNWMMALFGEEAQEEAFAVRPRSWPPRAPGRLLAASGAGVHFLDHPLQRIRRDVDVLSGHVIIDYDTSRELAGALIMVMAVARTAMV